MKKVLLATTALVMSAGIASAEITFSGLATLYAYDGIPVDGDDTRIEHNVDIFVDYTGETDTGLSFGAYFEIENLEGDGYNGVGGDTTSSGSNVFVSGAFGTLRYGNTDGAIDRSLTEVYRIIGGDYELWSANTVDNRDVGNILRYDYTFGDLRFVASYAGANESIGVGVSYADGTWEFGAAYEDHDFGELFGLSAGYSFGAFGIRGAYWNGEDPRGTAGDLEQIDVGVQYSFDAFTLGANYRMNQETDDDLYTVFATYDLGGGATLFAQTGETLYLGEKETITTAGISLDF